MAVTYSSLLRLQFRATEQVSFKSWFDCRECDIRGPYLQLDLGVSV
jgi:hypothetical protein